MGTPRYAHVAVGVSILEPPREHKIDGRSGHDPEVTGHCHGSCEAITRDGHAQAALDQHRSCRIVNRDAIGCQHRAPSVAAGRLPTVPA
jgi:hypothetical protein